MCLIKCYYVNKVYCLENKNYIKVLSETLQPIDLIIFLILHIYDAQVLTQI